MASSNLGLAPQEASNVAAVSADKPFLQPLWDVFLEYEDYISSPAFLVVILVSYYVLAVTPWMLIDLFCSHWQWLKRYKIQTDKEVTWPLVRKAVILTSWNHLLYILPATVAQWVFIEKITLPREAPPLFEFLWQHIGALAIFDIEYYIWHSIHHKIRVLYRYIHSVHHQYHSPNAWVTQYLHPWELVSVGIFTNTAPLLLGAHPLTALSYQIMAIQVSIDAHVGYDMPFMMHRWFPFFGGSLHHDMHHQRPNTNFAPFFTVLDILFGTLCPGQEAGGWKSKALLDWEKRDKEERSAKRQKRDLLTKLKQQETSSSPPALPAACRSFAPYFTK